MNKTLQNTNDNKPAMPARISHINVWVEDEVFHIYSDGFMYKRRDHDAMMELFDMLSREMRLDAMYEEK